MRSRLLVLFQSVLVVSWLLLPAAGLAADPSPAAEPSTAAPSAAPSTEPSAEPTVDPSAAPSPVDPSTEPSAVVEPGAASPEPPPAASPVDEPISTPSPEPLEPATTVPTNDYVVTFVSDTSAPARSEILAAAGGDVVETIAPLRMAVVRVPVGSTVVDALNRDPGILRVERDRVRSVEATSDDPAYADQWSLPRIGWDHVFGTIEPTGTSVVAVLDTGVDAGHTDLAGRLVAGTSVLPGGDPTIDPNGHGTAMAGIIAAAADNDEGIAGIAFAGVSVMPVTVLDADGHGQDSDIIEGIVWAVDHGADVLNLCSATRATAPALQAAIDYAWDHDVLVVAATGNDGSSAPSYPAGDRGVVGVSNTDQSDQPGRFFELRSRHVPRGARRRHRHPPGWRRDDVHQRHVGLVGRGRRRGGPAPRDRSGRRQRHHRRAAGADRGCSRDAGRDRQWQARSRARGNRSRDGFRHAERRRVRRGWPVRRAICRGHGDDQPWGDDAEWLHGQHQCRPRFLDHARHERDDHRRRASPNWNSSRWALATAPPAIITMPCVDHANHTGAGTYTETFTITAPATAGTYNLYLYAYNGDFCLTGRSALFTRAAALDQVAPTVTINQAAAQVTRRTPARSASRSSSARSWPASRRPT